MRVEHPVIALWWVEGLSAESQGDREGPSNPGLEIDGQLANFVEGHQKHGSHSDADGAGRFYFKIGWPDCDRRNSDDMERPRVCIISRSREARGAEPVESVNYRF